MSNQPTNTSIEILSDQNLRMITELSLQFWNDCEFEEEYLHWKQLIGSPDHFCALALHQGQYAGFIHISIRYDYVEGATADKTAYLEGIYLQPAFRQLTLASQLLTAGEKWALSKGIREMGSDTAISNVISQQFHSKMGFTEVNRLVCYVKKI